MAVKLMLIAFLIVVGAVPVLCHYVKFSDDPDEQADVCVLTFLMALLAYLIALVVG